MTTTPDQSAAGDTAAAVFARPVHFEIHSANHDVMRAFYEQVFGWRFTSFAPMNYLMINTGDGDPMAGVPDSVPGINGGMPERQGPVPADGAPVNAWVVTVDVPDCQEYLDRAVAAGGSVALPVMPVPGGGRLAYAKDPEGNIFGIMQSDQSSPAPEGMPAD